MASVGEAVTHFLFSCTPTAEESWQRLRCVKNPSHFLQICYWTFKLVGNANERYVNGGLIKGGPSSQTFSGTLADFVCDFWRKTSDVTSEFWIALQTEFK